MRIAVVGLGQMGQHHARILRELGCEVVTIDPDNNEARCASVADTSIPSFAGAVIATPVASLASMAAQFQSYGVPTLIEKPLAESVVEAEGLDAMLTSVGYVERFNPALATLSEWLPRIGKVQHIESRRLGKHPGRNVIADLATHEFDVLRYLGFSPTPTGAMVSGDHPDHASISWADSRASGTITASYYYPVKVRTVELVGTEGMLTLDYQDQSAFLRQLDRSTRIDLPASPEPLRLELESWLALNSFGIGSSQGDPATLDDGIAALKFVEQVEAIGAEVDRKICV